MTLEDVIKGLECCSKGDCADCDNCTYHGVQTDVPCESTLMRDALALLKAQEPRVMTLDELRMNEVYEALTKPKQKRTYAKMDGERRDGDA